MAGGRKQVLELLKVAGRDQVMATPLVFIEILDGDRAAADILNQILFYRDVFQSADGWVYITAERWKADAGLTHFQLERAFKGDKRAKKRRYRRILTDVGARREKRYRNGSNTWYYTVDDARLLEVIAAHLANVELQHVEVLHAEPKHVETAPDTRASFSQLKHVEVEHVELQHVEPEHVELQQCSTSNFNNVEVRSSTLTAANKTPESLEESLRDSLEIDSGEVAERAGAREDPATTAAAEIPQSDIERIVSIYEANIGPITPLLRDEMLDALMEFQPRWIIHAMTEAVEANALSWRYVRTVCERIKADGGDLKGRKSKNGSGQKTPPLRLVDSGPAMSDDPVNDADTRRRWRDAAAEFNDATPDWMRDAPPAQPLPEPTTPEVEPSAAIPGAALDAWQMVHEQLRQQWDAPTFDRLLRDAYLARVEVDPGGDVFLIAVPSAAARDGLRPQTRAALCKLLAAAYGSRVQLDVVVGQPPAGPAPKPMADLLRERWLQRVEKSEPAGVGK